MVDGVAGSPDPDTTCFSFGTPKHTTPSPYPATTLDAEGSHRRSTTEGSRWLMTSRGCAWTARPCWSHWD